MAIIPYFSVRTRETLTLLSLSGVFFACQGPQRPLEEASETATSSLKQSSELGTSHKNSEARLAPDEMFFAGQYVSLLVRFSQKQPNPSWSEHSLQSRTDGAVFEFSANFSKHRLDLATQLVLLTADGDKDGWLNEAEFAAFQWDPKTAGALGPVQNWTFSKDVFQKLAQGEAAVSSEELRHWLAAMGPLLKQELDLQGEQTYRQTLLQAWDAVLLQHDTNQDGHLDSVERKTLTQERAKTLLLLSRS